VWRTQIPQWRPTYGAETGDGDDGHSSRPQAIHDVQHTHAPTHVDDRLNGDQPAAAAHDVEPLGLLTHMSHTHDVKCDDEGDDKLPNASRTHDADSGAHYRMAAR